jgi:hypothetical protein
MEPSVGEKIQALALEEGRARLVSAQRQTPTQCKMISRGGLEELTVKE